MVRRRFRIDRMTALIALMAILLGVLYMVAATWVESRFAGAVPSGSSLSKSSVGLSAWHDYLADLGERPQLLTDFSSLPATGTLVVGTPLETDFSRGDLTRMSSWVKAGGRVILVGNEAARIAADVFGGGSNTGSSAVASSVAPAFPSPLVGGVGAIATGDSGGSVLNGPAWVPVFADKAGTEVGTRRFGSGEVVWLIDAMPVTNAGIALYDDARFAVRLARAGGSGPLYFDEYHHGLTTQSTAWSRLGAAGRTAVALLFAAVLVLLFARGRRTGPAIARPEVPAARGSAYIAQLASLYRVAGARADALASLEDGLMRVLVRRYGGRGAGLERHARSRAALDASAALRQRGSIDRNEFVTTAAQLRAARNEVEGGNG